MTFPIYKRGDSKEAGSLLKKETVDPLTRIKESNRVAIAALDEAINQLEELVSSWEELV